MKFKTRFDNILAKIANKDGVRNISPKTKEEYLLCEISDIDDPFIVGFTGTTSGGNAACDKTWNEIKAAYKDGKRIVVQYGTASEFGSATTYMYLDMTVKYYTSHLQVGGPALTSLHAFGIDIGEISSSTIPVSYIRCSIDNSGVEILCDISDVEVSK